MDSQRTKLYTASGALGFRANAAIVMKAIERKLLNHFYKSHRYPPILLKVILIRLLNGKPMKKIYILTTAILTLLLACNNVYAKELSIKIKQGMPYLKARKLLLADGWQTVTVHATPNGTPICFKVEDMEPSDEFYEELSNSQSCKYVEIDSCSGTGMGFCNMIFYDGEKTYLTVITDGGEPPDAQVNKWSKSSKKH